MDFDTLLGSIAEKLTKIREASADVHKTELYEDEPISPRKEPIPSLAIDEKVKEMKTIAENTASVWLARESIFLKQARLMENYEDDFSETPAFHCYYPTYRDMNVCQLRYYFSWRTKLRRGEYMKIGASYVFVYIYELISLIGCSSTEDGFHKLRQLYNNIKEDSSETDLILYHLKKWMFDFVIYYDLSPSFLEEIYDGKDDMALTVLKNREAYSNDEVFSALSHMSSYNISKSKFFSEYPEDYKAVAVGTYDSMCRYSEKHRKITYFERLFGKEYIAPYRIFEACVFRPDSKKGYEYKVNSVLSYKTSSTGAWYSKRFFSSGKKNKTVGKLLKAVDRIMRKEYGFGSPLAEDDITKLLSSIIEEQIKLCKEEKKRKERAEIKIDMNLLSGIRRSADITRDRLIVEEETEEEPKEVTSAIAEYIEIDGLDSAESAFLRLLIKGEKYRGATPASLLCDSINEKLYDRFDDTVIEFDGDEPQIIEDYIEELEEILK